MNMRCTAYLKFDAKKVAKNAIYTAFICNFCFRFTHTFLSQKLFMHFFVTKRICAHFFFREHGLHIFFAKTIDALRPESFCALKVAIWKVQTFWASAFQRMCAIFFGMFAVQKVGDEGSERGQLSLLVCLSCPLVNSNLQAMQESSLQLQKT